MRAHAGIGTSQAHLTVSTAPMTITVSFREPVSLGRAGCCTRTRALRSAPACRMSAGRCTAQEGELLASFAQDALIRPLRTSDTAIKTEARL